MTVAILLALAGILCALAAAGFFMLRRPGKDAKQNAMAKALAWRVGLSISLFAFIMLCWAMGWIEPRGVPLNR